MAKVYVVQEIRDKDGEPIHDLSPSAAYGEIEVMLPINRVGIAVQPLIPRVKHALRNFTDDDYLLLVGDPVLIGVATSVALSNNRGRAKVLRWDRFNRSYIELQIDTRGSDD